MKNYIYSFIFSGIILTGCNAGSQADPASSAPKLNTINELSSTYSLESYPTYIHANIINNSSQIVTISSVPDSDYLDCKFAGQGAQYNCGDSSGWSDNVKPDALQGQSINPSSSINFNLIMDYSNANKSFNTDPTISLSLYGNSVPLFGIWEDGTGAPNPQNHYSSKYANNILEVQNWDSGNPGNSSLFVGAGNAGGLIENNSYTINSDGSINLTITITNNANATPYTRTANSVAGNSLCAIGTPICPSILNTATPSSIVSDNGFYQLDMQTDGNLVIYDVVGTAIWSSGTSGSGNWLSMQTDGNLVVYSASNQALWASNTVNSGANSFRLMNNGNLELLTASGQVVWTNVLAYLI